MTRRSRTGGAIARATLATATSACLALALHAPAAAPHAQLKLVDGTLSQSNSKAGAAILSAHDMRPGDTATGSVTIANTGTARGYFTLSSFDLTDVPGRGGGLLSTALVARVLDVTDPAAPRRVYTGGLGSMTDRTLGAIGPGAERTYSFSVGLSPGGPALDAVQGGSVSIGYRWTAATSWSGPTTTTTTAPPPTPPATPPPTGTPTPPGGGSTAPPPPPDLKPFKLTVAGRSSWSARSPAGPTITASCTRTCSLHAAVRVHGMHRKLALKVRSKPMASSAAHATQFEIMLPERSLRRIRHALAAQRRIAIAVTVTAIDDFKLTATGRKLIRVTR